MARWGIKAGEYIKSGMGIEAGYSIEAGSYIDCEGRIFAGTDINKLEETMENTIKCYELKNGTIAYGNLIIVPLGEEAKNSNGSMNKEVTEMHISKINNSTQFITLPDKKLTDSIGNTVYYCYQGEIVECICCDVRYDFGRKIWEIHLVADDKIFPYRDPIAEFDDDPTDWCTESIIEPIEKFNSTIFITREEAEKSLVE